MKNEAKLELGMERGKQGRYMGGWMGGGTERRRDRLHGKAKKETLKKEKRGD